MAMTAVMAMPLSLPDVRVPLVHIAGAMVLMG